MSNIGVLNEKPLHASLKKWYAQPGDQIEVKVEGFVIDIVQGDLLVEIQTGNFASIKPKLNKLLSSHSVRLVYPIAYEKWIVKLPKNVGGEITRRKSPKRGRVEEVFGEMVSFPQLLENSNFSLEVLMTKEEEFWQYEGKRKWRRKGWGIKERRLLEVVDQILFEDPADWHTLLPRGMGEFTGKDLAERMGIRKQLSQKMAYCLRKANIIKLTGKRGRANLYEVSGT
ncbi:MAG: hypothetical protein HQ525_08935 [Anaerolineae bacterium]|nr:hypothetical protein [Anaerolineae bacterium]